MRIGAFELAEPVPELKDPHAIVVLRPWINVGRVGTMALSKLEKHFGARDLGELSRPGDFFDFTRYRPRTRFVNGRRTVTIPNTLIRYASTNGGQDFLFLHMREPHAMGEDYTDSILEVLKSLRVKRYCLIGGMYDIVPHTRTLLVSGSSTEPVGDSLLKDLGVHNSNYEGPTTITYLITQEAPKIGIENMSLIVRLPQYVQLEEDHAGTARLLELLGSVYNLPPQLYDPERGRRQYQELTAAVEQNPEVRQVLQQLEAQYDSQQDVASGASRITLSPELERFLEELDTDFESDLG